MLLLNPMHLEQETSIYKAYPNWVIFCDVVDNYGDIGISWRLARQLVAEHGLKVCLWTNDLTSFQKINAEIDPCLSLQCTRGVEVRRWSKTSAFDEPADVVIEAFGCVLPEAYIAAMANSGRHHAWINLEYLSAEGWVDGHHALPSPHPRWPLTKYFYFPGFSQKSGGLLAEKKLLEQRVIFQTAPQCSIEFWFDLGIPPPENNEIRISLFCYNNNLATNLFADWEKSTYSIVCLVPEGVAKEQLISFFGVKDPKKGGVMKKGNLKVIVLPFLEQDKYDQLLWACDFNFVRGEDSFVRAQWAAHPMVWQIYPQENDVHWSKLRAFMTLYSANLPQAAAKALIQFMDTWNGCNADPLDWESVWKHRAILEKHAQKWANKLIKEEDLTTSLVNFCNNKLE